MTVKPGWARKRDRLRRREAAATPAAAAGAPPAAAAGPPWALSAAEWRMLVITFAGGLGSIVVAAGVIGGAIALARYQEKHGLVPFAVVTLVALIGFAFALAVFRKPATDRADRVLKWFSIGLTGFGFVLGALIWIGLAAGVK